FYMDTPMPGSCQSLGHVKLICASIVRALWHAEGFDHRSAQHPLSRAYHCAVSILPFGWCEVSLDPRFRLLPKARPFYRAQEKLAGTLEILNRKFPDQVASMFLNDGKVR